MQQNVLPSSRTHFCSRFYFFAQRSSRRTCRWHPGCLPFVFTTAPLQCVTHLRKAYDLDLNLILLHVRGLIISSHAISMLHEVIHARMGHGKTVVLVQSCRQRSNITIPRCVKAQIALGKWRPNRSFIALLNMSVVNLWRSQAANPAARTDVRPSQCPEPSSSPPTTTTLLSP